MEALNLLPKIIVIKNNCELGKIHNVKCPQCGKQAKAFKSFHNSHLIINCKPCGFSFTE